MLSGLKMMIEQHSPDALNIVHSDQGSQYTAADYQALIKCQGAVCSISRKGHCWDNAVADTFFHTLKTELVHHYDCRSRDQAQASILRYIEVFYNCKRRHSFIGNQAPLAFELHYGNL